MKPRLKCLQSPGGMGDDGWPIWFGGMVARYPGAHPVLGDTVHVVVTNSDQSRGLLGHFRWQGLLLLRRLRHRQVFE